MSYYCLMESTNRGFAQVQLIRVRVHVSNHKKFEIFKNDFGHWPVKPIGIIRKTKTQAKTTGAVTQQLFYGCKVFWYCFLIQAVTKLPLSFRMLRLLWCALAVPPYCASPLEERQDWRKVAHSAKRAVSKVYTFPTFIYNQMIISVGYLVEVCESSLCRRQICHVCSRFVHPQLLLSPTCDRQYSSTHF